MTNLHNALTPRFGMPQPRPLGWQVEVSLPNLGGHLRQGTMGYSTEDQVEPSWLMVDNRVKLLVNSDIVISSGRTKF